MKNKLIIPFIFAILISVVLLVSCDKSSDDGQTEVQTPSGTQIFSDSFSIDNDKLYVKVSNDTSTFSFIDKIETADGATYTLSSDIKGTNVIRSKTVELDVGDNTYYIIVENDKDMALYTATIRRRPIYEVVFDVKGGTEVEKQYVEEDDFAIVPTTEKNGCAFERWDWDFATSITKNITITAIWDAFAYNIIYDLNIPEDSVSQEVDNSMNPKTYTVDDSIYFSEPKRNGYYFTGWSISKIVKGTTGTVTTTAQWSPITYEIIYDFNDEKSVSKAKNNDLNPRYYNIESEITFSEPTRAGYSFVSWNKNIEKGTTGAQTITANWDVIDFNINYVLNGWTNAVGNKRTYTIEDQRFALFDGISGESLFCGWYLDDEYTNCIATIDASTMKDYTVYAMPDCGATKGLTIENGVVKGYSGASNEVVIPSFYKGYAVDSLVGSSFNNCAILTSVTIPDSVKSIGEGAFSGCSSLENITIPFVGAKAGVTSGDKYQYPFGYIFGTASYDGGVATKQYYYENSTSSTTYSTYYIPSFLQSVVFTGENILYGAFYNCSGLASITIDDRVKSIGEDAFLGCSGLTSVYVTDIAKWCAIRFESFTSNPLYYAHEIYLDGVLVKNLTIPDGVTGIGNYAFYGCSGLMSVTIPDSMASIGSFAFSSCTGLTKITGSTDVVSVAARQCDSKAFEIVITSGTRIDDSAFQYCNGLTNITIPDCVTNIGYLAFYRCSGLTSVIIPDSVTSIDREAFSGCSGLTNAIIGKGVTDIGVFAFSGCSALMTVNWNANASVSAGYNIFKGCSKLTTVNIGNNVTSIGSYVFYGCENIASITIPDSVISIGSGAFSSCTGLTRITGPSDMVSIVAKQCNSKAFDIVITSGTSIGDSAFQYCNGLTGITISDCVTIIGSSAFDKCVGLASVTILDSVTSIGEDAFRGCSGLTSITIPNGVTSIGDSAFDGCSVLTTVNWNANACTSAGSLAYPIFKDCLSLKEANIGDEVTVIPSYAFFGCSGLTSVVIPESVTTIGDLAFEECSGLSAVIISNGVSSIGDRAFRDCTSLTRLKIGKSVISIGYLVFYGCSSLTSINFEGTKEQWEAIIKGDNWDSNCGSYVVQCTDGNIEKTN